MFESLVERKILIAGDSNLDDSKRYAPDYRYKHLFEHQNVLFDQHNLMQLIDFPTWSRVVNNVMKNSILDHVYVQDPTFVTNINSISPLIGDHKMLILDIMSHSEPLKIYVKRNWQLYSKLSLLEEISQVEFNIETDDVQSTWNNFENILLPIVDKLVPLTEFSNNSAIKSLKPTAKIKRKLDLRKRLLKSLQCTPSNELQNRIKTLNTEIKHHFLNIKSNSIRPKILPGNSKSLWDAVNIAKDVNAQQMPH